MSLVDGVTTFGGYFRRIVRVLKGQFGFSLKNFSTSFRFLSNAKYFGSLLPRETETVSLPEVDLATFLYSAVTQDIGDLT